MEVIEVDSHLFFAHVRVLELHLGELLDDVSFATQALFDQSH